MTERVALLVGTRKGLFVLDGDAERDTWDVRGPLCDGWPIHDAIVDSSGTLYAGGGSNWYGPAVWRSQALGRTWSHSSEGLTYGDDGEKIATIWNLSEGPDALYAGVLRTATLSVTDDEQAFADRSDIDIVGAPRASAFRSPSITVSTACAALTRGTSDTSAT